VKTRRTRRERLGGTKSPQAERDWLHGFTRFAMGDVSLDSDEAAFVARMAAIAGSPGHPLPDERQCRRIRELAFRLWYTPDEPIRLTPRPGFDWERVDWSAPEAPDPDACSYCGTPLYSDDKPLPWRRDDGWRAVFCAECQATWFGVFDPLPATAADV
jgi:hypothetical protein